jgi:hypothetical protein
MTTLGVVMTNVHLEFSNTVKEIHADWGGYLTGYLVLCSKQIPTQPLGEVKQWFGGAISTRMDLVIETGRLGLDAIMQDLSCSPLEAMEILSGKILERKLLRDRQGREQRGKR